jgi:RNA polymerase sigma factor (sigma-70 family)
VAYGIARHQLGRYFRRGVVDARARRMLGLPDRDLSTEDYERIEELIDLENVRRSLVEAFSVLSADQREAMTLRVIEGRTYEEIARAMRCTEEAARARVSRGLRRLTALMEERHPELIREEVI